MKASQQTLIRLLQNAHAGEKAAAFAYRGHAKSVTDAREKCEIQAIEQEEWDHRECLSKMLQTLGAKPRWSRELVMGFIGSVIYCLCRLGGWLNFFNFGWFMSMYGAGKLEQGNIIEYEVIALHAVDCGHPEFVEDLLHMSEVEWDHEIYFRTKAQNSPWAKKIKIWQPPPPRDTARIKLTSGQNGT